MVKRLSIVGYMAANDMHRFICDDVSDINTLPTKTSKGTVEPYYDECGVGSTAIVIAEQSEYMLNNQNEWKFYKNLNGGSSIVTPEGEIDVATLGEIANYIV